MNNQLVERSHRSSISELTDWITDAEETLEL